MVPKFEFHGIKPAFINGGLRAFVQTVLPTIYDDSLSYYELLNKVVKHLNNVVADVATLNTNQEQFIAVVTDFINRYGIETYDLDIANPLDPAQLQLSEDAATALFEAIANNKVVRVFVHNAATGTVYTCYYCTIDTSTVEPNVNKNDLYFAGYNFRQLESAATSIPWKIVKIERNGAITIYDNVNAVTKKYVDDSIQNAANAIGRRIDTVENKSPYKIMFDVYPDPDTPRQYIVESDDTPVSVGMLHDAGRDIECYLVRKAAADGVVIETVKADSVVFGQSKIIITFDNTSGTDTIYKVGYNVISGDTATNEWSYQVSSKVSGRVDFNIETTGSETRLVSASHTPAEVYRLYQDYNGFVPCAVYFNGAITGGGETITNHVKTNAVVRITDTQHGYLINVDFDDITNGANSLDITHYSIQGFSETNDWNFSSFAHEYPNAAVEKISINDLPNVTSGVYTLGEVEVTQPVQFPRIQNREIIIVNTVFNIKTPVLFPAYRNDTFFTLPSFVGCTFNNGTNGRVLVASGSTDLVGGRCTGCNFINVDFAESTYLQDYNFVNCYIHSYQTFLNNPTSTVQARFVNCDVESESHTLINGKKVNVYMSGTYEGNSARDEYYITAENGTFTFQSCWFESSKVLNLTGGTTAQGSSTINLIGCEIQINSTPQIVVTNPEFVHLNINGSYLVAFNNQSVFINKTAEQLASVTGDFTRTYSDGYVKPIGGALAEDRAIATMFDLKELDEKRFFYRRVLLNAAAISGGGVSYTLPTGRWLFVGGRGFSAAKVVLVYAYPGTDSASAGALTLVPTVPSNDVYVNGLTFTATKSAATDTTFTLTVNATETAFYEISAIKID